jgi:cytochrome c peroxidase
VRHLPALLAIVLLLVACATAARDHATSDAVARAAELRAVYSGPPASWPAPEIDPEVDFVELGRVPAPEFPPDKPWSEAKEELGKALFFDARLSGTGQMACASCHDAELGWTDGRSTSFGHDFQKLGRNAPSILNVAFGRSFFWDGRAESLEDQALAVFRNAGEMHSDDDAVAAAVLTEPRYGPMFAAAYGDEQVTIERVLEAIATYERTVTSKGSSAFDRFLAGDAEALDDAAVRGLHLFRTRARCANCHHGPLLTDHGFHNLGLTYYERKYEDLGRYRVTGNPADVGRFKTPSLRNVARTAPYMHNGMFSLDGVINMYSAGMPDVVRKPEQVDDELFPRKSPLLQKLDLTDEERADLTAFLESLTERRRRVLPPDQSTASER